MGLAFSQSAGIRRSDPRYRFATPALCPTALPSRTRSPSPNGNFDNLKIEASDYDDGFAKIVHAVQPVSANLLDEEPGGLHVQKDMGIRLGWDDEQLLIWQNRQVLSDPQLQARASTRRLASLPIAWMCARRTRPTGARWSRSVTAKN